ncbi:MAG: hypothetical protein JRN26_08430 [Nitrososphaerota archaeon]|jgi:hypothetical protein|nr:hypothetical protein [Nitrososphaerota archaeon]MDG6936885.1 hypothetical protein [Nitrososphaerota archaeon]MDG6944876.1 hypothetical protein [Nitrososphaerota archaeon]
MSYVLNAKQAVAFTTSFIPFNVVPSSFIALCRLKGNEDDMIMDQIIRREDVKIVNDAAYMERSLFRNERKRPWGRRTRGPFRGIIEEGVTFEQKLKLAKKVVNKLGVPFKKSKKGRKRLFSTRKLIAAVLAKGNLSFVDLAAELKEMGYDASLSGEHISPSKSTLFNVFSSLPRDYLEEALKLLDGIAAELYAGFNENMNVFAGDNSAITCDNMVMRKVKGKDKLIRDTSDFYAVVRLPTNTIRLITEHRNLIIRTVEVIPRGSTLLLDAGVEMNYEL